ncbi:excinuclease ABC subunit UvrB [Candidatus Gottesmanbacteria bacterium]|nr:excinuclease ABC subunit UvrB [Candidatus Gottesmanbacteria bacterium]
MKQFKLSSPFQPSGDQPEAITSLLRYAQKGLGEQVLLGVTGSGKTYTMAAVIARLNRPTLVISHNKTLAAQLYQEFRDFFPKNAVSYFVSYYDYYQPEAYVPQTDTYIEKETEINEEIDKLRLAATTNLLTRRDTIVVASVSCIYNIGSPREYGHFVLELATGMKVARQSIFTRLVQLQYERSDYGFHRGTFRVRGETIDLFPAYEDTAIRMVVSSDKLEKLVKLDPMTGKTIEVLSGIMIYPAKHYMTDPVRHKSVFVQIRDDLAKQITRFKDQGKMLEAHRIEQRVNYDLEMIQEMGYVNGIENYSRYFDGRNPGDPPYTLLDYFGEAAGDDWLLFIDESHMSLPQIRGMYNGDRSRKQTLIDYGFRLPAALDNRPLRFEEFLRQIPKSCVYVSATPDQWELSRGPVTQQLVRPTGLIDPKVSVRPTSGQIDDLTGEITKRVEKKERILVTTLTKRMAEDLSRFLEERGIKVHYLHADIQTLERSDILADLRKGAYDVVVGINLLREGLDLPEVSLVAILDADKEGFLRSRTSLIQTMGRAARHVSGEVIFYADVMTNSMKDAIAEGERRREIQLEFNKKHGITPKSIKKPIRERLVEKEIEEEEQDVRQMLSLSQKDLDAMTPKDKLELTKKLEKSMRQTARDLNFELAAKLRDFISTL